ncbi:TIGR00341 family protein [Aurantiacibacter poecillastricola]|uniref:TIGR00341 family protein n=1 Tax=Aurantiacibacter poecillastricola TaxID=3064385 RepID=UPI00273F6E7D|nr:TIGR00341 family protein [Aurantiacibacter sp. 219JJ12-13]MDP5260108.1 TIGR00341 family protein [Aurantiacibacter sp. 219JJ12-13]
MQSEPTSDHQPATGAAAAGEVRGPTTGFRQVLSSLRDWWGHDVTGTVDQIAVVEKRRSECQLSARYLLMVSMSAGIAVLGLLQGSAAVVIGAMLLSPLMDPIMGVGFALAVGDYKWLRQSIKSLAVGTAFAIAFCALLVFISPLQSITEEIAARTRPNLFDLAVAIFSAIAGAYAMIRGREGTIVGVAIATALMPPLAVVGFGLATFNGTVFWGALLLFITNLTAIALTATLMARLYGFSTSLSERGSQLQSVGVGVAFVALAVPLGLSLQSIAWETQAQRVVREDIFAVFDGNAENVDPEIEFQEDLVTVTATVYTNELYETSSVESQAAALLERKLGRPTEVTILQIESADAREAELAQLGENRAREAELRETAEEIAQRLALLAGVEEDEVMVDRDRRRALVTARPIPGASLGVYSELENRIDATEPDWDIRLTPPALALPQVTFRQVEGEDGEPGSYELTEQGTQAVALIAWAQKRTGLPITASGPADSLAALRNVLAYHEVAIDARESGRGYGPVTVGWRTGGND